MYQNLSQAVPPLASDPSIVLRIVSFLLLVGIGACGPGRPDIRESGIQATESRPLPAFTQVQIRQPLKTQIEVKPGQDPQVQIDGDESLLAMVIAQVQDGMLVLDSTAPDDYIATRSLQVRVVAPALDRIDVSGASRTTVSSVASDTLALVARGAAQLHVEGTAKHLVLTASGVSQVTARGLKSERGEVYCTGSSKAQVCTTEKLVINLVGTSKADAFCQPETTSADVDSGSSLQME